MAKYRITLVTEASTAAEAVARVAFDTDSEFIDHWSQISVEPIVPQAFATGGFVSGSSYGSINKENK